MSITINQEMIDKIANDDTIDGALITFSTNVDPGNPIQEFGEDLAALLDVTFNPDVLTMPAGDITLMIEIAELWDDLIARDIEHVTGDDEADITVNPIDNLPAGVGGLTFTTLHVPLVPEDIDAYLPNATIMAGTATWETAVHEFGHALGLDHPGDYNATGSGKITYQNDRTYDEDTALFSVMSYFDPSNYNLAAFWDKTKILTPMIYDILAIQQLYGTDKETRLSDTTYGFNSTAGRSVFLFLATGAPVLTIWDSGGQHDRLDTSGFSFNQRIDLHPGTYSDVGNLNQNIGIAFGTWIEDAVGGSGFDDITGNELDNQLAGGAGNDKLRGESGNDTLTGGDNDDLLFGDGGADSLDGGVGKDELHGGLANDTLLGRGGNDKLYGDFGIDSLNGGTGNDILDGGGSRDGAGGDGLTPDKLTGSDGEDTFIYQAGYQTTVITDFHQLVLEVDMLDVSNTPAHSFSELLSFGTQQGTNTVFNFGNGNVLTLQNFRLDELDPGVMKFSEAPLAPGEFVLFVDNVHRYGFGTHTAPLNTGGFIEMEVRSGDVFHPPVLIAHRFDARGVAIDTLEVNSTPLGYIDFNYGIQVAVLSDGRIVVAWNGDTNNSADGIGDSIRARVFNADGIPVAPEFVVNTTPPVPQPIGGRVFFRLLDLTPTPGGGFVIDWASNEDPMDFKYDIHLRRRGYDAAGDPVGPDQDLGTSGIVYPNEDDYDDRYLSLSDGNILHFWQTQSIGTALHGFAQIIGQTVAVQLDQTLASVGTFNGVINDLRASELEDGRIVFTWKQRNYYPTGGGNPDETQAIILDSDLHGFTRSGTMGDDTPENGSYNFQFHGLGGSNYNDRLYGLKGNDILAGRAGPDLLHGGSDSDTSDYLTSLQAVNVDLTRIGAQKGGHADGDILVSIENLTGSAYADTLTGNALANVIQGGYGDDVINGQAGADQLFGDRGHDTISGHDGADLIIGGLGNDNLNGGTGTDTVSFATATAGVIVNLALFVQQNTVNAGRDTLSSFENLTGSNFNDTLTGSGAANRIIGGLGNDILNGSDGIDTASYSTAAAAVTVNLGRLVQQNTVNAGLDRLSNFENLTGSNFNDTLTGSAAANRIIGSLGNDTLFGKTGNDILTGGAGFDSFVFNTALNAATNKDRISDFIVADDTIRLEKAIFTMLFTTPGTLAPANFVSGAGAVALDNSDFLVYDTTNGNLYYDVDGSGTAARVEFVSFTGIPALTAGNFVVVI